MRKLRTRVIVAISAVLAIAIVCFVVYNVVSDYAIDLMFKASQQSLVEQNEIEFQKQKAKTIKEYEERIKLVEKQKQISLKVKKEKEKLLIQEREKKLTQIKQEKTASAVSSSLSIPDDIKKQMRAMAIRGLGADGVSKCIGMLSGGITAEEKGELKILFSTRFSAAEKKQILIWAAKYAS